MPYLLPYQQKGKDFLLSKPVAYLSDVMGLGKSCQALLAAQNLVDNKRILSVLIVCPAVLQMNWANELEKWGVTFDATIISYDSLHKLQNQKFHLIIADEAHKIKNPQAKRTKLFYYLAAKAKYVWLLSGTPVTRCSTDLYPFCKFSGIFTGNYWQFAERYAEKKLLNVKGRLIKQYQGGRNLKELKSMLKPFMLRRFKKDVQAELPEKIHNDVLLSRENTSKYEGYLDDVESLLENQAPKESLSKEDKLHIATLRKDLGLAKVMDAKKFIWSITEDTDEQVIIFAHHRDVLQDLSNHFQSIGGTVGMIIGGQKESEREKIFEGWKEGKIQYLILSLEAASVGLNLTEANKAFFVELPWNPSTLEQAIGRIHRIGQKEVTNIYFLLRANSFDMAVQKIILNKQNMINKLVGKTE